MVRSVILFLLLASCTTQQNLVVFSKTSGYRHDSIPEGIQAVQKIGKELGFTVIPTEDSSDLLSENYEVLVFLSPTLDVLNETEQEHLRKFVEKGGGFVGIHSATNCEYEFDWYINTLVGAKFASHRQIKSLDVDVIDSMHPSTKHLPNPWTRTDEWYNFDRAPENVIVLLEIEDEDGRRPISWCRQIEHGRSFYTGGGHTKESYSDPQFLNHIKGGIEWVSE
jgi:type 1 glutamine amidotransferase